MMTVQVLIFIDNSMKIPNKPPPVPQCGTDPFLPSAEPRYFWFFNIEGLAKEGKETDCPPC
jgi:hypothetical protein